jgi:hypothetical protein
MVLVVTVRMDIAYIQSDLEVYKHGNQHVSVVQIQPLILPN